jgi:hypothetical protein
VKLEPILSRGVVRDACNPMLNVVVLALPRLELPVRLALSFDLQNVLFALRAQT